MLSKITKIKIDLKMKNGPGAVAHICNSSYSKGKDSEVRPAMAKSETPFQ
jgi:hypothetical protein